MAPQFTAMNGFLARASGHGRSRQHFLPGTLRVIRISPSRLDLWQRPPAPSPRRARSSRGCNRDSTAPRRSWRVGQQRECIFGAGMDGVDGGQGVVGDAAGDDSAWCVRREPLPLTNVGLGQRPSGDPAFSGAEHGKGLLDASACVPEAPCPLRSWSRW